MLCNVSQLILDPHKLEAAAGKANESAQLKLFKRLWYYSTAKQWSDAKKWDQYISMVKFVDSGFKPSEADVAASVKQRSVVILLIGLSSADNRIDSTWPHGAPSFSSQSTVNSDFGWGSLKLLHQKSKQQGWWHLGILGLDTIGR